jgi:hypothetical protein
MAETIAALPAAVNLSLYRGDDFGPQEFIWEQPAGTPVDITGYTITAQIRASQDATDILASFACTITDAPAGKWTIALTDAQTTTLPSSAYWDLQLTSPGGVTRTFAAGRVKVTRDVTRPS